MTTPRKLAWGECWTCSSWFWYGILTVPSVPVDRAGNAVEETGGTVVYRLAPICPVCLGKINRERAAEGLPLLDADALSPVEEAIGPAADDVSESLWFVPANGLPYRLDEIKPAQRVEPMGEPAGGLLAKAMGVDDTQEITPGCDVCGAAYGTAHDVSCGCPAGFSQDCSRWVSSGVCECSRLAGLAPHAKGGRTMEELLRSAGEETDDAAHG